MPVNKITHKGVDIVYIDCTNQTGEQMMQTLKEGEQLIFSMGSKSIYLVSNVAGSTPNAAFDKYAMEVAKKHKSLIKYQAVVGLNFTKKVLVNAFAKMTSMNLHIFDTSEQAFDYMANKG